ncbi:hypothetical protein F5B21DRAFT_464176 [Xylaria acuta]|nr:hypothetical protein F5B21DRAFT_464176 [Xylaria acuta]
MVLHLICLLISLSLFCKTLIKLSVVGSGISSEPRTVHSPSLVIWSSKMFAAPSLLLTVSSPLLLASAETCHLQLP